MPNKVHKPRSFYLTEYGPVISILEPVQNIFPPFWTPPNLDKVSFWAPSAPGRKLFRKIDPGIWNPTWNHEKMKVVPRNSVQNPGLEITLFRSLLCVRKQAFPCTVIYMFFHVLSPWRRRRNNFGNLSGYPSTPGPR